MTNQIKTVTLGDGIRFSSVRDQRFKSNRISINFFNPLDSETVTVNALIPQLLKKGFAGCDNFTAFNQQLEELYGACVEADIHKKGDMQVTTVAITVLDDSFALDEEKISCLAAKILASMVFNPIIENNAFRSSDVEIEKKALIDAIEAELNEKRTYAINSAIRLMCEGEPYGIPRYGYKEKVDAITPVEVKKCYDELIKTAMIEVMFVGCGDESGALGVLKECFGSLSRSYSKAVETSAHNLNQEKKEKTEIMEVNQSKLVMGFAGNITALDPLAPAMRMAIAILGGTPSSKLFVNVREKMSLCYYCAARYDLLKGVLIIDSGVENQNIEKAKAEILVQLDDVKAGTFTDEDQEFALLYLKNAYSSIFEYDGSIEAFYLGQLMLNTLLSPEDEKRLLDSVTKGDIMKAAESISLDTIYLLTGKGE